MTLHLPRVKSESRTYLGSCSLIDPRHDARGARDIMPVFVTEGLAHELLFPPYAQKEQDAETDEPRRARNPVGQQEGLRQRPKPERGIHRMAHAAVDAVRDQRVLVAHFQGYRPVAPEVFVTAMKQPERRREQDCPYPSLPASECIIRESRLVREHINCRENSQPARRNGHEPEFALAVPPAPLWRVPRTPVVGVPNDKPGRDAQEPDQLGGKRGHYECCATSAGSVVEALQLPSGLMNSSSPTGAKAQLRKG